MQAYLTPKEIMDLLKMPRNTVYKLIRQNDFPKIKIGKTYRIPANELERFLERYEGKHYHLY